MPAARHRATRRRSPVVLAPVVLLASAGCTPGATSSQDDGETPAEEAPAATVTIPPARLSPFCRAMIELDERLLDTPPDEVEAEIITAYEEIEAEVPDEIRDDFIAVLADLRGEAPPATSDTTTTSAATNATPATEGNGSGVPPGDPFFDEGYDPDDDPALRLNAYVDFECRDVANNPGPPPTQPLSEPTTTQE